MNIRWTIYVLIIVCGFISCKSEKESLAFSNGKVIISGIIEEPDDNANIVTLISVGPVETIRKTELIDSAGAFRFEFDIIHPHIILIKYEKDIAYVYACQRDSLFLKLNSKALENEDLPAYVVSGKNAKTSMDIREYRPFNNLIKFQPDINKDLSVADFLVRLKKGIQKEDSVLSAFIKKYHPTNDFIILERKGIIYRYANYLIHYKYFHYKIKTKYSGDLFDKSIFPIDDDSALVSSSYGVHLSQYAMDKYMQQDTVVKHLLKEKEFLQAYRICLDNICQNEKPGLSRDVMCFRILNALRESSNSDFLTLWKNVNHFINDTTLINLMEKKNDLTEKQKNYGVSLLEPDSKEEQEIIVDFWNVIKEKYNGEIIYVDLWATYCGPCRVEIPHAIKLHKYYKNKPIAFVNICMSSDKVAWKDAIENQHIAGDNYFLNKAQTQLLSNKLDLQGYPTYLIFDKNGNMVDNSAPRPSSDIEIKAKLDELLKN